MKAGHKPSIHKDVEFHVEPRIEGERYQGSTCIWSGESFYFKRA